jgi:hypothetical protein
VRRDAEAVELVTLSAGARVLSARLCGGFFATFRPQVELEIRESLG